MTLDLSESYLLNAIDNYPSNLKDVAESLTYALSYNEDNVQANIYMGRLHFYYLDNHEIAEKHFNHALSVDNKNPTVYRYLIHLYIETNKFDKASKLINFAEKNPLIKKEELLSFEIKILEKKGDLKGARKKIKEAIKICNDQKKFEQLEKSLSRLKKKKVYFKKKTQKKSKNIEIKNKTHSDENTVEGPIWNSSTS